MAKKTKGNKKVSFNQFEDISGWIKFFKEHKKLPAQKITCSHCKHNTVSMFGPNLKNYLKKHKNNIEELLQTFECRACRNLHKDPKEPKPKKTYVNPLSVMTKEELEERAEKIKKDLPKMEFTKLPFITPTDKEGVESLTSVACQRPDIYLDNGKWCDGCPWIKYCVCDLKRFHKAA